MKREDPKGTSQASLKYTEEPAQTTAIPTTRRSFGRPPPLEPATRDGSLNRRGGGGIGDDRAPLLPTQIPSRQPRPGDVSTAASLPAYQRPADREYPIPARKKSGPGDSGDAGYYVGYAPEHEQALPYVKRCSPPYLLARSHWCLLRSHALFVDRLLLCVHHLMHRFQSEHAAFLFCLFATCIPSLRSCITKAISLSILTGDRHHSNKASTISLELGSNKHVVTPKSQLISSGQYSSSTIRSDRLPFYRQN